MSPRATTGIAGWAEFWGAAGITSELCVTYDEAGGTQLTYVTAWVPAHGVIQRARVMVDQFSRLDAI